MRLCIKVLTSMAIFWLAPLCQAGDSLRSFVTEVAQSTIKVLDQHQLKTVSVFGIEDGTTLGATSASGIERMLKDEFKAAGRFKENRSEVGVKGKLKMEKAVAGREDSLVLELRFSDMLGAPLPALDGDHLFERADQNSVGPRSVLDRKGKIIDRVQIKETVFKSSTSSPEATMTAFGLNGTYSPVRDEKTGQESSNLADFIRTPKCVIQNGNTAKTDYSSDFGVRIRSDSGVKTLRMLDGQPFVDFDANEKFSIEVSSKSQKAIAAEFTIDGLNSFYFSKTPQEHGSSWVISPHSTKGMESLLALGGWYVERGAADQFVATEYSQSKRREAGLSESPIGGISVIFFDTKDNRPQEGEFKRRVTYSVQLPTIDGKMSPKLLERDEAAVYMSARTYIGGGEKLLRAEPRPSDLSPTVPLETVTVRFRHPASP